MADELVLTLPDGSESTVPKGTTPRALGGAIRPPRGGGGPPPAALPAPPPGRPPVPPRGARRLWPDAGIGLAPPIEDGFYYDFAVPRPFTPEDLEKIEAGMRDVVRGGFP